MTSKEAVDQIREFEKNSSWTMVSRDETSDTCTLKLTSSLPEHMQGVKIGVLIKR